MIEDDVELAQLLKSCLYKSGIDVTAASTPLEGLKLFQAQIFDMLILDLSLPQMDGMEICRLIRQESDIPIIISSARSDIKDKKMGFSRGADDYLPKPYDPQELIFRIDAIMRRINPAISKKISAYEVDENRHEITKKRCFIKFDASRVRYRLLHDKKG